MIDNREIQNPKIMKLKNHMWLTPLLLAALALGPILGAAPAMAGDLTYTPIAAQSSDQDVQIMHKQAVMLEPALYAAVSASGTTTVTASRVDRVTVGTPGTASSIVLKDGTNTIITVQTTLVGTFPLTLALTSGTLTAVTTGTASAVITYR